MAEFLIIYQNFQPHILQKYTFFTSFPMYSLSSNDIVLVIIELFNILFFRILIELSNLIKYKEKEAHILQIFHFSQAHQLKSAKTDQYLHFSF